MERRRALYKNEPELNLSLERHTAMRNRMTVALPSLLVSLALASCADPGRSVDAGADGREPVSTVAAPAQVYEVVAPVLENETHGPRLCLGTILYSLPPQCGEVPITNWDWESADGEETLAGTTWGNYHVTGTYDGTEFTLTETPRPADREPTPPTDLHTPCQEPPGGWPVPDPDRTSEADIAAASTFVSGQPDAGGFWVDDPTPPSDGATAMHDAVLNVAYTGDLASHEAELRRYWGGPLCLIQVARSRSELLAIQRELTSGVAEELGLFVLSAGSEAIHNRVHLTAVLVTPDQQRSLDERYGPGVVIAESRLRPIG